MTEFEQSYRIVKKLNFYNSSKNFLKEAYKNKNIKN